MTNTHAFATVRTPLQAAVQRQFADVITSVRLAAATFTRKAIDSIQHRKVMKRFERFSDHDLQDVGFERDWDGSLLPINR